MVVLNLYCSRWVFFFFSNNMLSVFFLEDIEHAPADRNEKMQLSTWNPQMGNILSEPAEWSWWRVLSQCATLFVLSPLLRPRRWLSLNCTLSSVLWCHDWHCYLNPRGLWVWFRIVFAWPPCASRFCQNRHNTNWQLYFVRSCEGQCAW